MHPGRGKCCRMQRGLTGFMKKSVTNKPKRMPSPKIGDKRKIADKKSVA